ncbi:flagellar hook-associated protein FlgL [Chromohalobacter canadensis]|uniref:flagellar hook-associated protein FlgL n=1 Tax=Chromohalobacter canadensis TaxID=141389 RepID=UPI0021C1ED7B|nr:flagellar hook-associated protein FlgL [Chromohalobacter canadensis]MCT8469792.1 flagellar hook-associated protein FlgL [Chromohalobacter canadensis]MCT8472373.1 flagellar hook-associated protein FlgL [Chromohalobacter canadensis]MCT8499514.1 flagellar hook-associated protein FlgL [Chromohalobacter canadensis]
MRISTVTMYEQGVSAMNRQQADFTQVGQQIASGKSVVNPSDDPRAASRAVGVSQSLAVNEQQESSRVTARNSLSQEESVLGSVSDTIGSAKSLVVQAGNGTLSDADRESLASDLEGAYETLIGLGNTTDGNGTYLFSGYQDNAKAFSRTDAGANVDTISYEGDQGVKQQKIDAERSMNTSDTGSDVFMKFSSGSEYIAEAGEGNTGSMTFSGPDVRDAGDPANGESFDISFNGDGTYDISSSGTEFTDQTNVAYTDGETIEFGGMALTLEGEPADGDSLSVTPGGDMDKEQASLFKTIGDTINALRQPVETDADQAALDNTLSTASRKLDASLDNVLTTRASVGARMNELDALDDVGGNREIAYEQTRSDLVDLDYNSAISDYMLSQVGLQASQKSFADIQQMSLFQYLN